MSTEWQHAQSEGFCIISPLDVSKTESSKEKARGFFIRLLLCATALAWDPRPLIPDIDSAMSLKFHPMILMQLVRVAMQCSDMSLCSYLKSTKCYSSISVIRNMVHVFVAVFAFLQ